MEYTTVLFCILAFFASIGISAIACEVFSLGKNKVRGVKKAVLVLYLSGENGDILLKKGIEALALCGAPEQYINVYDEGLTPDSRAACLILAENDDRISFIS